MKKNETVISRRAFTALFGKAVTNKPYFYQLFDEILEHLVVTDHFVLKYNDELEMVNIFFLGNAINPFPAIISWYKLYHIGRGLETLGVYDRHSIRYIIKLLGEELDAKYLSK